MRGASEDQRIEFETKCDLRQEVRLLRTKLERQEDEIFSLTQAVERFSLREEKSRLREEREGEEQSEASGYGGSSRWECITASKGSPR